VFLGRLFRICEQSGQSDAALVIAEQREILG
jgi:hypothetical protein